MSACKVCGGVGEVVIPPTMEEPEDVVPCDACAETGVEPPDAPDWYDEEEPMCLGTWSDHYSHYREQGVDEAEAATLADRDMVDPREEALVYY
jgi:hypothetical protein